jgi:excisionase family DNA binding protein
VETLPEESVARDWVSLLEAERFSGLGRRTLWRLIRSGRLCATKIGGAMMIDKHSLETYTSDHGYAEQLRLFD